VTPEPYSEADARQQLIDQKLELAGWNVDDPSQVIQELDIYVGNLERPAAAVRETRRTYAGHQFADYALLLAGKPRAVVEAKKTSRDARLGQEQALQYAEKLKSIHGGSTPFVMYTNGHSTYFWDTDSSAPVRSLKDDTSFL
jgi:type I restriction enzyme R subunit